MVLPDSVKSINENAFYGTALNTIKIPEKIKNKQPSFDYSTLSKIELPESLTYVTMDAFILQMSES